MSGVTKDTIQKILLIALSAMTVSMVLISVFNYKENREKSDYLDKEKVLVQAELKQIIKSYDHLAKYNKINSAEVIAERTKAKEFQKKISQSALDYETIIKFREQLLILRKSNHQLKHQLHSDGISSGRLNTAY